MWRARCLSVVMLITAVGVYGAQLQRIDAVSSQDHIRLAMHWSAPTQCRVFSLDSPARLVMDCAGQHGLAQSLAHWAESQSWLKGLRQHASTQQSRFVFDLQQPVSRIDEVQLQGRDMRLPFQLGRGVTLHKPAKAVSSRPQPSVKHKPASQVTHYRPIVVVIDPGHGGKDPGASSARGIKEKQVVLRIAKFLARDLNQSFGFEAKLTRSGDKFLALRQRLNVARQQGADMFISIHADAYKNKQAHGASVFALSERGATSEAARWLAEHENNSELMGGVKLSNRGNVLRSVLLDLSQTATTGASLEAGADVLSHLRPVAHLHKGKVEQAAFVVLKSPDIPSLLIETGFVSNPQESRLLSNPSYQARMAKAISQGIQQYFDKRPLEGSMVAANKRGILRHKVIQGDHLSAIAHRYHTSVAALKAVNHLDSDKLLVGQVLLLPVQKLH